MGLSTRHKRCHQIQSEERNSINEISLEKTVGEKDLATEGGGGGERESCVHSESCKLYTSSAALRKACRPNQDRTSVIHSRDFEFISEFY